MDFRCSFFIKNGPFVRCRETADTAQRDAVLCTAKTRKEGIYDEHFHLPPSVPEGQRPGSRRCLRSRPADWLRRLFLRQRFRRSLFRFRLQLHHPVRQPARYPELPDHRHRPRDGRGRKLRGYAGRVRQQGRHARRPGHQLGLGYQHPDLDVPSAWTATARSWPPSPHRTSWTL